MTKGFSIPHGRNAVYGEHRRRHTDPERERAGRVKAHFGASCGLTQERSAIANAMKAGTPAMTKSARQPIASTAGPPITTPSTGASPPATLRQLPMARARWPAGNCAATSAMAAVPVAPPPFG